MTSPFTAIRYASAMVLLSLAVAGCGMGDYMERMDKERARVRIFDEETRILDEPLIVPMKPPEKAGEPEEPVWPFPVLLRLPLGVSGRANASFQNQSPVALYRYSGKDAPTILVAAGMIAEEQKDSSIYKPGEWPVEDFQRNVRTIALSRDYYNKLYNGNLDFSGVQMVKDIKEPKSWRPGEQLPKVEYDRYVVNDDANQAIKDHSQFELYFHQNGGRQIAIIFQLPQRMKDDPSTRAAVDLCLKSLDISDQAPARREKLDAQRARQGKR
jgi:hypothetical protein